MKIRTGYHGVPERIGGRGGGAGIFGVEFKAGGDGTDCKGALACTLILREERGRTGVDVKTWKGKLSRSRRGHEQIEEHSDCHAEEEENEDHEGEKNRPLVLPGEDGDAAWVLVGCVFEEGLVFS